MTNNTQDQKVVTDASFNDSPLSMAYFSNHGRLLTANTKLERVLGYKSDELNKLDFTEIVHPEDISTFTKLFFDLRSGHSLASSETIRCFNSSGKLLHLRFIVNAILDSGEMKHAFTVIDAQKPQTKTISSTGSFPLKWFEAIAEHVPVSLWVSDLDVTELSYCNKNFIKLWDITQDDLPLTSMEVLSKRIFPEDLDNVTKFFNTGIEKKTGWKQKYRIQHQSGRVLHVEDYCTILYDDDGEARYRLGAHRDISDTVVHAENLERMNSELEKAYENVKRLSQYDSLTGCFNREAIMSKLSNALYQYVRYEIPSSIIYIDLNGFKAVNDKYGHLAGDQVLKNFVDTMQNGIRQTDELGRLGGDEFLLLFPGATHINAEQFLKKTGQSFETRIGLPNTNPFSLNLKYSFGVADLDFSIKNVDEWIDIADKAMYKHKNSPVGFD